MHNESETIMHVTELIKNEIKNGNTVKPGMKKKQSPKAHLKIGIDKNQISRKTSNCWSEFVVIKCVLCLSRQTWNEWDLIVCDCVAEGCRLMQSCCELIVTPEIECCQTLKTDIWGFHMARVSVNHCPSSALKWLQVTKCCSACCNTQNW